MKSGPEDALAIVEVDGEGYGLRVSEETGARWLLRLVLQIEGAGVAPKTIRNWAALDHPYEAGRKLLPRGRPVGDRWRAPTYLARNVREAVRVQRAVQHERSNPFG